MEKMYTYFYGRVMYMFVHTNKGKSKLNVFRLLFTAKLNNHTRSTISRINDRPRSTIL